MSVEEPVNAPDIGLCFAMNGGTLPSFIDLDGRKLVLITQEEYGELVAARSRVLRTAFEPLAKRSDRRHLSTIERDPEVADFLATRFRGGVIVEAIRSACLNTFGPERTPSRQRIGQFRLRLARCR